MTINRTRLREGLVQCYNLSELETLCVDLNVDYDVLPGEDKISKSRELIGYLERRGLLESLLEYCRKDRPAFNWEAVKEVEPTTPTVSPAPLAPSILETDWQAEFNIRFLKAAVVWVTVAKPSIGMCCGFLVEPRGYIVAFELAQLQNASQIVVSWNGRNYEAEPIGSDSDSMVALLKLSRVAGRLFPALQLGINEPVKPNDPVFLMGYDTRNWLNRSGRVIEVGIRLHNYKIPAILADIPSHPGFAGAPAINRNGRVVGVLFASDAQGHAALIPAEYVYRLLIAHM
ncbi:MAG: trypsin-like peptidase domain-containing protein [Anaerolineae bacterium]|nr:serine protease [Thermoflexales bacterium]MDW8408070.1 trypsin-like peptidase domain-containing protein [Anaerolineae bacterium]